MKKSVILRIAVFLLSLALLSGCVMRPEQSAEPQQEVQRELTAVLSAGEIAALGETCPELVRADLRGSSAYKEILEYMQLHPGVEVLYSVEFSDGTAVGNDAESLSLPTLSEADMELFSYLPALKSVEVGSLDAKAVTAFYAANPAVTLNGTFTAAGKDYALDTEELDLRTVSSAEAEEYCDVLPLLKRLKTVELGEMRETLDWEAIASLVAAAPHAEFRYAFELYGRSFTLQDEVLDLNHIPIDDCGALVRRVIPCMQKLNYLDMDFCGVSNEDMASIRDDFPNVKVVWRIWFGIHNEGGYSVRTDVERLLASTGQGGELNNYNTKELMYCTDVKYLDLGHNYPLDDISFISYMKDLQVCILAYNSLSDISPLSECTHLEYLELMRTNVEDITPISQLKELRHVNLVLSPVSDVSCLYGATWLERLYLGNFCPAPKEQLDTLIASLPDCEVDLIAAIPVGSHWRGEFNEKNEFIEHPRYTRIRETFGYTNRDYSYARNDPKYYAPDDPHARW